MEPLLLKTAEQIKIFASPDCRSIMEELSYDTGITAEELSKKLGKPLLDICYCIEKLEKNGFIKLIGGSTDSGILEKNYALTTKDYITKRVVGDYEEVEMEISNPKLISSEQPKRGCSFCGKSVDKVNKLIKGQADAHICDKCVAKCYGLLTKK